MPTRSTPRRKASARRARIAVQIAVRAGLAPRPAMLRRWAGAASTRSVQATLRVVGAREARDLNRGFRRRDYATNVLTFVYGRRPPAGDIVLCHPVLAREAREQGKALVAHYAHIVVHGMLHLRGHDHERRADAERMERLERRLLARLGFPDPYAPAPRAGATMARPAIRR